MDDSHTDGCRNPVQFGTQSGIGEYGKYSTRCGGRHRPTVPRRVKQRQSLRRFCGQRRGCAHIAEDFRAKNWPTKGTTPATGEGGEGRRVSAPGGRADTPSAKPSDPYYTHDSVTQRKGCQPEISHAFK